MVIENRAFDEIQIGESAALERRLTWRDIELFAVIDGTAVVLAPTEKVRRRQVAMPEVSLLER
jgi:hypothetical protein